ncbi:Hypothetical_protein [Hexamita inflata]|uniref:Hypothetical_protein n=1 Tax=Hexamita inflata TaxID=28002 RepID=A0AA86UFZ5_9EUKA|nr:Hypothetical protein HINF_LOCUS44310 [Hexamita inflata]
MFTHIEYDDDLIINADHCNDCKNNLSQFYGKSYNQLKVCGLLKTGHKQEFLEFTLQSYRTNIELVKLDQCVIDLSKAHGEFKAVEFNNCELLNSLTNQFKANSATFNSDLKLSQLKSGNIKQINVFNYKTVQSKFEDDIYLYQYPCEIDFAGSKDINTLNELVMHYQTKTIDLSQLEGNWNKVQIQDCKLVNELSDKFYAKHFKAEIKPQTILCNLKSYLFEDLDLTIYQSHWNEFFDPEPLMELKFKTIKVTVNIMIVDLANIIGKFDQLTFHKCTLLNCGTEKLSAHKLELLNCIQNDKIGTIALQRINCKILNIQQQYVDFLPQNLQELQVQSCQLTIKNKQTHLQKISLNGISQINCVDMTLLPRLNCITSQHLNKTVQQMQRVIETRTKFQKRQTYNAQRMEKQVVKRETQLKLLDQIEDDIFYCMDTIETLQCGFE